MDILHLSTFSWEKSEFLLLTRGKNSQVKFKGSRDSRLSSAHPYNRTWWVVWRKGVQCAGGKSKILIPDVQTVCMAAPHVVVMRKPSLWPHVGFKINCFLPPGPFGSLRTVANRQFNGLFLLTTHLTQMYKVFHSKISFMTLQSPTGYPKIQFTSDTA